MGEWVRCSCGASYRVPVLPLVVTLALRPAPGRYEKRAGGGSGTQTFVARQDFPNSQFCCFPRWSLWSGGGGGGWHEAMVLVCLPLAVPIGLSLLYIPTLCGSELVLVVSTEPLEGGMGGGGP